MSSERNELREIIAEGFTARGLKEGDVVDSFAIAQMYVGSCSLKLDDIRELVREVGRAKAIVVS